MRVRRSREEIDAGMTVDQKKKGMSLEDILAKTPTKTRISKAAGYLKLMEKDEEQKKNQKKLLRKTRKKANSKKYARTETRAVIIDATQAGQAKMPTRTVYSDKIIEVPVEVPTIKEVRILNGTKGSSKEVKDFLKEELQKCKWEWKEVVLDKSFEFGILEKLGKEGWKFAHAMSWKAVKSSWKDRKDSLFFHRSVV